MRRNNEEFRNNNLLFPIESEFLEVLLLKRSCRRCVLTRQRFGRPGDPRRSWDPRGSADPLVNRWYFGQRSIHSLFLLKNERRSESESEREEEVR